MVLCSPLQTLAVPSGPLQCLLWSFAVLCGPLRCFLWSFAVFSQTVQQVGLASELLCITHKKANDLQHVVDYGWGGRQRRQATA